MVTNKKNLLDSYKLNYLLTLKNRIVMAPMTRAKAGDQQVPTNDMAEYYARRAAAGLIITEGTVISPDASGYKNIPGIFSAAQIAGWRQVTDKVHAHDGKIFLQIWHVGRVSHPTFLNGNLPISASATDMTGTISRSPDLTYGKSRAATPDEILGIISHYAEAAKNAVAAGADGIEIHGANGYLIDQFLHYDTNKREDEYGLVPENMARFALEIVRACGAAIGYERVGLRLSPGAYLNQIIGDERDANVFEYLLTQLNSLPIAYVHVGNFDDTKLFKELGDLTMSKFIRAHYQGTLIASGGYLVEQAQAGIEHQDFDLVAMGRPFIANSNLIQLIRDNAQLKPYEVSMLENLY